ncbi:MAG: hypothetical protein DWQ02_14980 [Bacteroidetes bacterium]|nr:MAG: hypothetical protein DWQ02_14980 [Bacteroidota bacterium]
MTYVNQGKITNVNPECLKFYLDDKGEMALKMLNETIIILKLPKTVLDQSGVFRERFFDRIMEIIHPGT